MDLLELERQDGVVLSRKWTMDDPIEDMLLEIRRVTLARDEKNNVSMMREGLRLVVTGLEVFNERFGFLDLEGWSTETCNDLDKHNQNLARIYRKYWRRTTSSSPEIDVALALLGSAGMHHLKRSMSKTLMAKARGGSVSRSKSKFQTRVMEDSSDEEDVPRSNVR